MRRFQLATAASWDAIVSWRLCLKVSIPCHLSKAEMRKSASSVSSQLATLNIQLPSLLPKPIRRRGITTGYPPGLSFSLELLDLYN